MVSPQRSPTGSQQATSYVDEERVHFPRPSNEVKGLKRHPKREDADDSECYEQVHVVSHELGCGQ